MKLLCKDNGISYGVIGTKTSLRDKRNNVLSVGDVVVLRNKKSAWSKLRFVAYDYQTQSYYIMGNHQNSDDFEYVLVINHEVLSEGFGIGNVYCVKE